MNDDIKKWAKNVLDGKLKPKTEPLSIDLITPGAVFKAKRSVPVVIFRLWSDSSMPDLFVAGGLGANPFLAFSNYRRPKTQKELFEKFKKGGYAYLGQITTNYDSFSS
jgi:hypothetical protein